MFSIILAIVAIGLVTLLALATVYYGGSSATSSMSDAKQAALLNQASTLQAAVQLYQNDHQNAYPPAATASTALLQGNYLAAWPATSGVVWGVQNGYAITSTDTSLCAAVDKKLGLSSVPSCSDPAYQDTVVCCRQ